MDVEKLLTVIVPSYNMENYLPKCLGSLVVDDADMLNRLDVIVVNDGSKDRTSEIAHGFEAKYPGVFRVIDKANGNYGSCINAALPMAKGRFVKILDADDTYDTAAFTRYLRALAALPAATDMVMNDWIRVDAACRVTKTRTYPLPTDKAFGVETHVKNKCSMAMHATAYRTALLKEIGYSQLEGISYTDTEWFYRPPAFAREIRYVKQPVYRYWGGRTGQTMEHATFVKNIWMMDKILDRMLKQYDTESSSHASRSYLEFRMKRALAIALPAHLDASLRPQLAEYSEKVRRMIATHGFLSEAVRSITIFTRSPFRFRYAEFILRHPFLGRFVLPFVNKYSSIRAKV